MRKHRSVRTGLVFFLLISLLLVACSDQTAPAENPSRGTGNNQSNSTSPQVSPTPVNEYLKFPTVPPAGVTSGGSVTGAIIAEPETLDYYKTNNPASLNVIKLLFSAGLTRRNPGTLALEPGAADNWSIDTTTSTITFRLKSNLKWSDGAPLTADDYVWTYQQARKSENGWPLLSAVFAGQGPNSSTGIESYTAPDASTLVVKLRAYTSDLVARADVIEPLPRHIWEKLDWNDPAKNPEINKPTVVNGPWLLKEWKPGVSLNFSKNANSSLYPVPNLDSLNFKVVGDGETALKLMKSGEVDFFRPAASDVANFEQIPAAQIYTFTPGAATFQFAGFNFRKTYLQNKALRQAMLLALDRQKVLDQAGFKQGRVTYSSIPSWNLYFNGSVNRNNFSLDKARETLKTAGYTGMDAKLVDPKGTAIPALKLVYAGPSTVYDEIARQLKQSFATIGVTLETQALDSSSYVKLINGDGTGFDMFLAGWQTSYDPENFGEIWANVPELNSGAYRNDKLLEIYNNTSKEPDAAKRRALLNQTQQIEAEDLPYLFLYAEYDRLAVNRRIQGISQNLTGINYRLYSDWYLAKP